MIITLDFETRSACDLKKAGAWTYSLDQTTDVICLWFCSRKLTTTLWRPGDPVPAWLPKAISSGAEFEAHNLLFEVSMWRHILVPRYGFPDIPNEQWSDTMAVCARKALPLDLAKASRVLGLPIEKDDEGHKAMLRVCKPTGKANEFNEDADLMARTIAYGETDTKAQALLGKRLGSLEPTERDIFDLNLKMNIRGLGIDLPFVADCQAVYDEATRPLLAKWEALTGGLKPKSYARVREYFNTALESAGSDLRFSNTAKDTIAEALNEWNLPKEVSNLVQIHSALTSASVAKLKAMRNCVAPDGRAHGLLQYHAATTGRDGGRLIQPTNFPRGKVELGKDENGRDIPAWEVLVPAIQARDVFGLGFMLGDMEIDRGIDPELAPLLAPVSAVTSALRHCLVPAPGNVFNVADFSTIEARVVLALAGQRDILQKMSDPALGYDPYCDLASMVLQRPINKKDNKIERQEIGKPGVLGCGFQMGAPKFHDQYMKKKPFELAESIVNTYRKEWAPGVPKLWYGLQEAATRAVLDRRPSEFRGIVYQIEDNWLTCRLPSGRKLYYYEPRRVSRLMPWSTPEEPDIREGFTYKAMKTGKWTTIDAYGGLLTENVVQATARDILYNRALALEKEGFSLVLNVYDECVADVPLARSNIALMQEIMEAAATDIPWVKELGIPIAAEPWEGDRYRK